MGKNVFGLAKLEYAPVAGDGDAGTDFVKTPNTVKGTCQLTQGDNTTTDFKIEESDSPIESLVSEYGNIELAFSTYGLDYIAMRDLFGCTGNLAQAVGSVNVLGTITAGSSYTAGFYPDVPLIGGAGSGARANIKISGGGVVSVEMTALGAGYANGNSLGVAAANVGGTGSGFAIALTSVHGAAKGETIEIPDFFSDQERTLKVTDKKGNVLLIPRGKISAKLNLSFSTDKLGQADFVVTVLQPTKSGVKRATLTKAA